MRAYYKLGDRIPYSGSYRLMLGHHRKSIRIHNFPIRNGSVYFMERFTTGGNPSWSDYDTTKNKTQETKNMAMSKRLELTRILKETNARWKAKATKKEYSLGYVPGP